MTKHKCHFPEGVSIKPDGENELEACQYVLMQEYKNVTVQVWQCPVCGHIDISWKRQDDTEEVINDELII